MTTPTPEAVAELEKDLLANSCDEPGDCGDPVCAMLHKAADTLAALAAERDRATADASCSTCGGTPHASGKVCVCGGSNLAWREAEGLRRLLLDAHAERDALARRVEEARWRDAAAEVPALEDHGWSFPTIAATTDGKVVEAYYNHDDGRWYSGEWSDDFRLDVTHWMPMPTHPLTPDRSVS